MEYKGYIIETCYDPGIQRINNDGKIERVHGYFCMVYDNQEAVENGEYSDCFTLGVGYDLKDDSDSELEKAIRNYID